MVSGKVHNKSIKPCNFIKLLRSKDEKNQNASD